MILSRFVLVLTFAAQCYAQSNQAAISGVVTDAQGGVVPETTVTATDIATGVQTPTKTNSAGYYRLQNLPIGIYKLTVDHVGFRQYVREKITLTTGQELGVDVKLEVGATGQTVNVTAEAAAIETRTSEINTLIESKSIDALPLGNRRTLNVVQLSGAAVFVGYPNTPANVNPNFSLAGGRTQSQMAWIDGGNAQNMRMGAGQINLDPPVEAVQEVKVLSNNYAAEYGGSAGGVVIETTKSGGNKLHGSAYEFLRNNAFDAPGFFAPVANGSKVIPKLRYNVFGATVGGPIKRDKTFFFFDYEGQRLRTGSTQTLTVPTLLQRAGNFSQTFNTAGKLIPIYDPSSTQLVSGVNVRQQYPNNIIPASQLDPVGLAMATYYPVPNQPGNIAGANNFSGNSVTGTPADFYMIKLDHNFRDADRVAFRYMRVSGASTLSSVYPFHGAGDPTNTAENNIQYYYGSWTHILSSSKVNDLRFTFNDRVFHNVSAGLGGDYPTKLGLKNVPNDAFPRIAPAGFSALGATQQERRQYPIRQQQVVDNFSWIHGRHSLKFGFEARRSFNEDVLRTSVSGSYTFSTQATGLPGNTTTGNGLASMLIGFPTGFTELQTQTLDRTSWYYGAFAQDDWTVTPNLTFNLGMRWETDTPMLDQHNRMNSFDPSQINPVSGTPGVVKFLGINGYPDEPYPTDWNNFGPRFGFAWKALGTEAMVVRGGFGIFFAHPFDAGVPNANSLGFSTSLDLSSPDQGLTTPYRLNQPVPASLSSPVLNDAFGAVPVGATPNTAVTFFDRSRATGYAQQFNLGVQRQLPGSLMIEATVLGNVSHKLPVAALSLNQILPSVLSPQHSSQKDRPYPQFTNVSIQNATLGDSKYFAGMLRVEKRFSHGLNFGASYTYSKFLGNINDSGSSLGAENGPYSNYYNRRADWGNSPNDINHRLSFNWFYELPFGAGKRWLASNPLRYVVGGWSIGNVGTVQTGPPITVVDQTNNCNCFSAGSQRPTVLHNPNLPSDQRSVSHWFDTAAFIQPAPYTFGNEGVGIIRAPGLVNLDFSVLRNFRITERITAEFRGEFFNALNHTNLGLPGQSFGSSAFGAISSSGPARQIELGARVVF
jgi:outer membrane receptor protein involved in Fe transport